jgi:hypothetical protein
MRPAQACEQGVDDVVIRVESGLGVQLLDRGRAFVEIER